jgi:hypothetical protein
MKEITKIRAKINEIITKNQNKTIQRMMKQRYGFSKK